MRVDGASIAEHVVIGNRNSRHGDVLQRGDEPSVEIGLCVRGDCTRQLRRCVLAQHAHDAHRLQRRRLCVRDARSCRLLRMGLAQSEERCADARDAWIKRNGVGAAQSRRSACRQRPRHRMREARFPSNRGRARACQMRLVGIGLPLVREATRPPDATNHPPVPNVTCPRARLRNSSARLPLPAWLRR